MNKYKKCVAIPPLAMIDDILAVTECSLKSVKVNAMIESHVKSMHLNMGERKNASICTLVRISTNADRFK